MDLDIELIINEIRDIEVILRNNGKIIFCENFRSFERLIEQYYKKKKEFLSDKETYNYLIRNNSDLQDK